MLLCQSETTFGVVVAAAYVWPQLELGTQQSEQEQRDQRNVSHGKFKLALRQESVASTTHYTLCVRWPILGHVSQLQRRQRRRSESEHEKRRQQPD